MGLARHSKSASAEVTNQIAIRSNANSTSVQESFSRTTLIWSATWKIPPQVETFRGFRNAGTDVRGSGGDAEMVGWLRRNLHNQARHLSALGSGRTSFPSTTMASIGLAPLLSQAAAKYMEWRLCEGGKVANKATRKRLRIFELHRYLA